MSENQIEIEIVMDDGSIKKGFAKIEGEGKKAGSKFSKGFRSQLSGIGGSLAATLGLGVALGKISKDLISFNKSMGEVNTITQSLGINQDALKSKLIETSAQFGTSASEQVKSFYQIISAGVTDATKATELLTSANKLAVGGLTTTTGAVDLLTSAVNAYGQANLSAEEASDIIFTTVKLGKTNVEELQSSMGKILPTASALGISFVDVSAGLAALTTKGVSTSEATTQLNAVFTAVLKKQGEAALMGPKVSKAFSLQALKAKGLTTFMKDLNTTLGGSETKLTKLIGSAEGSKVILSLASDNFKTMANNVSELKDAAGASDEAFNIMSETLDFKLNKASAKTSSIFLTLSTTTSGPLSKALDFLNEQLDEVATAFKLFDSFEDFVGSAMTMMAISFVDFAATATEALFSIPLIGDQIKKSFGEDLVSSLKAQSEELNDSIVNFFIANPEQEEQIVDKANETGKKAGEGFATGLKETLDTVAAPGVFSTIESIRAGVSMSFASIALGAKAAGDSSLTMAEKTAAAADQMKINAKKIGSSMAQGVGKAAGSAFSALGKAIANGDDALGAFLDSFIASMGQMAVQLGTQFILQGAAYIFSGVPDLEAKGPGLIAAGAALATFGGVLSAVGGGGASETSAAGDTAIDSPIEADAEVNAIEERSSGVIINVEGTVLDPAGVGEQIAAVLTEAGFTNGARVLA